MDTLVVLLALVIFLGIVAYFGGHKAILAGLDARGNRVRAELEQAASLRGEAEALLRELQAKRATAEREAAKLVEDARAEADRLRSEQEVKLADFVARRTRQAEDKIAMAEAQATAEVRAAAADAAVKAAAVMLRSGSSADAFMDSGIAELRSRLN
jgi:F-type H+-transporting ATPase subunit b